VIKLETGLKYFLRLLMASSVFSEKEPMCLRTLKDDSRYFWQDSS
jgi:hypothetical protein